MGRVHELLIDSDTYLSVEAVNVLLDYVQKNSTDEDFAKTLAGCAKVFARKFIKHDNNQTSYNGLEMMIDQYDLAIRKNFYTSRKNFINLINSVARDEVDFDHPERDDLMEGRREKLRTLYELGIRHGASHEHSYQCQHTRRVYINTLDEMCSCYSSSRFTKDEVAQAILALLDTGARWEKVQMESAREIIESHPRVISHRLGKISQSIGGRADTTISKPKPVI